MAEIAWGEVNLFVTPNADAKVTLTDLKKYPNAPLTISQAFTILKDPSLRDEKGALTENITIHLDAGTYRLDKTLLIDKASSGNVEHPVMIEGSQDANVIISGGYEIHGFMPVTEPAALEKLPKTVPSHVLQTSLYKQGVTDFGMQARHGVGSSNIPTGLEVFYRNRPMTLARWPNQDFAKIATTPDGEKGLTFTVQGANVNAWIGEHDMLATGYWFYNWADATIPIKTIDLTAQRITLTEPVPTYGLKIGQPVFFQNALAELDQPGEWYLDKTSGVLYFWPPQPLQENEVEVSRLEKLLFIDNASYIRINNITFQNARGDAITVRGGQHVAIANSAIRNIGNRAAVISGQDNGLTNMLIEDIGESGVVLEGGDRQTLTPANLYVEGSTIRRFGRVSRAYKPAVLLTGVGNRAVGNHISDGPHTAILFTGNDHLISLNEIYDVCKETGDAGAIYTGRDWSARGTVISHNHIHDIAPNVTLGKTRGVYLDDYSSGNTVRGNLFERLFNAIFIHGGRDNLIEDNTFLKVESGIRLTVPERGWDNVPDEMKNFMRNRLGAVPFDRNPYKDKYPHLSNILQDEPGKPKYNTARRNLTIKESPSAPGIDSENGVAIEESPSQ